MMHRKKIVISIVFILALTISLCWAVPPFKMVLIDLKDHADIVRNQSKDIKHLVGRIHQLGVEIDELSNVTKFKHQKEKIQRLEEKVAQFQQLVVELDNKTDILKEVANKLRNESAMLFKAPHIGQINNKCGPGKIWIPTHIAPSGKRVPGYCARQ